MNPVNILIIEDHPLIRAGIKTTVEEDRNLRVVAEAENVSNGKEQFAVHSPDFVIIDLSLENSDGIDLIEWIRERDDHVPVLVVSMHEEAYYIKRAFNAGANGYLLKRESVKNISQAIYKVLSGSVYASESVSHAIISDIMVAEPPEPYEPQKLLSEQEFNIFKKLGTGLERKEIAERMNISPKTVETYIRRIKDKLHVENSARLTYIATKYQT